jgi:peptidoglycan/xylan/chitin deacetylase (PgdA/CDA1 family)
MKISYRSFFLVLFPAFLLGACVGYPRPDAETIKEPPVIFLPSPEDFKYPFNRFEHVLEKVKQNGKNIDKYFILDEGRIVVKAGLRDANGDFEIIYDLENAKKIGSSVYEVGFSCREKESGLFLKDALVWNPLASEAGLLLSFDDDYTASWERYFDLFDTYNTKVTFFVNGAAPNPFCAKALSRGHDVGYHSLSHRDLRQMSSIEIYREAIEPVKSFRDAGFSLSSFAYPFGFYDLWMHDTLLRSFGTLRGYGVIFRLYSEAEIRHGYISSRAIDNTVIPSDDDFYRIVNLMLMTVKFIDKNLILPMTTHDISASASWGISPRRLEYLLKTAGDLGLKFYRFSDFAK